MNSFFKELMGTAARLTQSGDLQGATQAIQQALGHAVASGRPSAPPPPAHDTVVDVEAREISAPAARLAVWPAAPQVRADRPSSEAAAGLSAAPEASRACAAPPGARDATAGAGEVLRGTYAGATGQRDYRLFVPPAYTGQPLPLVVMLHGCTQDPEDFAAGTAMDDAARELGFFVLYPAQSAQANPQRCWNWFKHSHQSRGRGEPALLAGLTQDVMQRYTVDPDRVYVAGLSAGGAMAAILGDTYPDLFAAVGVHSGLAAGAANDLPSALAAMKGSGVGVDLPASAALAGLRARLSPHPGQAVSARAGAVPVRPVPTIVFHGDKDTTVHPVNAEHIVAACVGPAANDDKGGASGQRARCRNGREYTRRLHKDAQGRHVAEHWLVHGAGHAWSGGSERGSYTDACGPDATREMLRFFFDHPRHEAASTW